MPCGAVAPAPRLQGLTPLLAGVSCPHTGKRSRTEAASAMGSQRSWGCPMRRSTFVLLGLNVYHAVALVLLVALAAPVRAQSPSPTAPPAGAQVQRLVFVSAGFNEGNRFWTIDRPSHLQFDPFLETLLDLDPKIGAFIPRLAEKREASPDLKEWTFYLRKGVPFHFGFGEFTARDVVHAHSLLVAPRSEEHTSELQSLT